VAIGAIIMAIEKLSLATIKKMMLAIEESTYSNQSVTWQ
jgi:hypothetical protein